MRFAKTFVVVAVLGLAGCGIAAKPPHVPASPSPASGQAVAAPTGGTFLSEKIPKQILNIPLADSSGHSLSLAAMTGKWVVITNFLTSCQEVCPMTSVNMRDIAVRIAMTSLKDKVKVVEVTVDAETDTPRRLAAYQKLFGDKNWTLATGTKKGLNDFWTYFGAPAEREVKSAKDAAGAPVDWQTGKPILVDFVHSDLVLIVGPDATWRWLDLGSPKTKSGKIPVKLRAFLSPLGAHNLAKPEEPSWTIDAVFGALTQLTGVKVE
jgi:cytochrome oxidase Cu insertion factor (SCO1/SenC/PrrC family)